MPFLAPIIGWIQGKALWLIGIGLAILAGLAMILRMQHKAEKAGAAAERARTAAAAVQRTNESRKVREDVETRTRNMPDDERARLRDKWTYRGD